MKNQNQKPKYPLCESEYPRHFYSIQLIKIWQRYEDTIKEAFENENH